MEYGVTADVAPLAESQPRLTARELAGLLPARSILELSGTWALIIAMIGAYLAHPTAWMLTVAFVIVASRQYALLILMHDAFHSLLHTNRTVNDLLGAVFIGYPCGSSYWPARSSHLLHHRTLGHDHDPERPLYSAADKRKLAGFAGHFARLMLGGQFLLAHVGATAAGGAARGLGRVVVRMLPVAAAQLCLLGIFVAVGGWTLYVVLWFLPLLTLTVLFNGLRVLCDHANFSDEPGDERHRLVSYGSNHLERFFLAPFHMNYHAEHHLYPYVPHYSLPRLRKKLRASAEHVSFVQWRGTYVGYLWRFLSAG